MALQSKTFSVGDLSYQSSSNAYILDLIVTEESTSASANTSLVSYRLQLRSGPNNRFSAYLPCYVTVNGVKTEKTVTISAAYNHTYTLIEGTETVAHKADGSFTLSVAGGTGAVDNKYAPPALTVTGTLALTNIPRASTIGANDTYIESTAVIAIGVQSTAYTHSIAWSFGSLSGYLNSSGTPVTSETKFSQTSLSFTIPESFYTQIPNDPYGTCTLTCKTYSGSSLVGTNTATFRVTADPSRCGPTVTGTVKDTNSATVALTGNDQKLVRYLSTAQCTLTASAQKSATVASTSINGTSGTSLTVKNVETGSFTFAVTDSRGYENAYPLPVTMVPYVKLTANASAKRTDPTSGKATLTVKGNYYAGSFGAADNSLTVKAVVSGVTHTLTPAISGNTYTATLSLTDMDYTQSHSISVTVSDKLTSLSKTAVLGKGLPVFDWGEGDFAFHVPVTMTKVNGADATTLYRGVCADANTTYKTGSYRLSDNSTNVPTNNGLMVVFGLDNMENAPVLQMAMNFSGASRWSRVLWWGQIYDWKSF